MNDKWNHVKETLNITVHAQKFLGKIAFKQKDWISRDIMKKIQGRKKAKRNKTKHEQLNQKPNYGIWKHTRKQRAASYRIRGTDVKQLATAAEEAAGKGNLSERCARYYLAKTLSRKQRQVMTTTKDKEGNVLTNIDDKLN